MNLIQYGNPGGMPATQDDFNFLQLSLKDMLNALGSSLMGAGGVILQGGGLTLVGGSYFVASGYVYIASLKEIFYCLGGDTGSNNINTLTWNVIDTPTAPDPVTFANQVSRNIHRTRTVLLANVVGGTPYTSTPTYANALINALSGINSPALAPEANWTLVGVSIARDVFGNVTLQGNCQPSAGAAQVALILPAGKGLRPATPQQFSTTLGVAYPNLNAGWVVIWPNGNVEVSSAQPGVPFILNLPPWKGVS